MRRKGVMDAMGHGPWSKVEGRRRRSTALDVDSTTTYGPARHFIVTST